MNMKYCIWILRFNISPRYSGYWARPSNLIGLWVVFLKGGGNVSVNYAWEEGCEGYMVIRRAYCREIPEPQARWYFSVSLVVWCGCELNANYRLYSPLPGLTHKNPLPNPFPFPPPSSWLMQRNMGSLETKCWRQQSHNAEGTWVSDTLVDKKLPITQKYLPMTLYEQEINFSYLNHW